MEAVLLRSGSGAIPAAVSPRLRTSLSFSSHDRHINVSDFGCTKFSASPLKFSDHRSSGSGFLRRAMSESDMMRSGIEASEMRLLTGSGGSRSARIAEEKEEWFGVGIWDEMKLEEEIGVPGGGEIGVPGGGGGGGGGGKGYGGSGGGESESKKQLDEYYKQMLKLNPTDPLLLINYARFLHEVVKDTKRADEYYGRAILANPGDGEVLGLYAKFIWETQKDSERARCYFDQAVHASPENSMVMGMYAAFMWVVEEDEEEDEAEMSMAVASPISSQASTAAVISAY